MIEREFITQKTKECYIKKYIESKLRGVGISSIKLKKIPLGEKITIFANRPSLIVGTKGSNIKELTKVLKKEFKLENPQIEINEIKNFFLDANIVAERISSSLERFGSARFKSIGHKMMDNIIKSGAMGVEIILSGKIPGARAKNWRFYQGYLKKCGDVALTKVDRAQKMALLKSGVIGIKVAIMPPGIELPDHIEILPELTQVIEEVEEVKAKKKQTKAKKSDKKKSSKKKVTKKKTPKSEADKKEESPIKEVESVKEKEIIKTESTKTEEQEATKVAENSPQTSPQTDNQNEVVPEPESENPTIQEKVVEEKSEEEQDNKNETTEESTPENEVAQK